jgi:hypothetical protein
MSRPERLPKFRNRPPQKTKTPEPLCPGVSFFKSCSYCSYVVGAELPVCPANDVPQYAQFDHPGPSFLWHALQVRINSAPQDGQNVNDCAESLLHFGHGVGIGSRITK